MQMNYKSIIKQVRMRYMYFIHEKFHSWEKFYSWMNNFLSRILNESVDSVKKTASIQNSILHRLLLSIFLPFKDLSEVLRVVLCCYKFRNWFVHESSWFVSWVQHTESMIRSQLFTARWRWILPEQLNLHPSLAFCNKSFPCGSKK